VSAVRVAVDGRPLSQRLEGTPLRVDPGEHTFTFEATGTQPIALRFVLKEGEKGRRERVLLGAIGPIPPPTAAGPASGQPQAPAVHVGDSAPAPVPPLDGSAGGLGNRKTLGLVVGGVGLVGVVIGSVFGLLASSNWSSSQSACGSPINCPNHAQAVSDHDSAVTHGAISTAGFIAGGVLLAGGAILYLSAGTTPRAPTSGLVVSPSLEPHAAALSVKGRF
jgi:hypothetical protein